MTDYTQSEAGSYESKQWLLGDEKQKIREDIEPCNHYMHGPWPWIIHIGLALLSLSMFLHGVMNFRQCQLQPGATTWYDRHVSSEHIYHRFVEDNHSLYRIPSPAADEAWDKLFIYDPFRINEDQFSEIDAPQDSVRFSASQGGGYRGTLGVFHHLHCAKLLWQNAHRDYYGTREQWFFKDSEELLVSHLDHCADVVRQALLCNPDLSLDTYDGSSDPKAPAHNHGILRRCRNYDEVLDWVKAQPRPE